MFRHLDDESRDLPFERAPERGGIPAAPLARTEQERESAIVLGRGGVYRLTPEQKDTLFDIGRFRTVAVEDLLSHRYQGDAARFREDLRNLTTQGLLERRSAKMRIGSQQLPVLVLTKNGKELVERAQAELRDPQTVYAGFVKPSEVAHDAAIYRMFHAERTRIEAQQGRIQRLVLDYELKRRVYAPLAKARQLSKPEYQKRQAEVAAQHHLKVIRGRVVLPDLRIEYVTAAGDLARVDLELATHHYHASHMAAKAAAGFRFYAPAEAVAGLSRALEERDITVEILSL